MATPVVSLGSFGSFGSVVRSFFYRLYYVNLHQNRTRSYWLQMLQNPSGKEPHSLCMWFLPARVLCECFSTDLEMHDARFSSTRSKNVTSIPFTWATPAVDVGCCVFLPPGDLLPCFLLLLLLLLLLSLVRLFLRHRAWFRIPHTVSALICSSPASTACFQGGGNTSQRIICFTSLPTELLLTPICFVVFLLRNSNRRFR